MSIQLPLFGPSNETKIPNQQQQKLTNMYIVGDQTGGKYQTVFYPTPGLTVWSSDKSVSSSVRALHKNNNRLYAVIDDEFLVFDSAGNASTIGTLNTTTSEVYIASTNTEIAIVDGTNGYIHTIVSGVGTLSTIGGSFPSDPITLTAQDGYFIVSVEDSDSFFISNVNDGTTWSALDFENAEIVSDNISAVYSFRQILNVFGTESLEPYLNTADGVSASFPFTRQPDGIVQIGLTASKSIATSAQSLFWLGQDKNGNNMVLKQTGVNIELISTPAISYQLSALTTTEDAYAYVYRLEENEFYVLTFPTDKKTFVYNNSVNAWHNWSSYIDGIHSHHRSKDHAYVYGKNIVGDTESGILYYLDVNNFTDNGTAITREMVSAPIHLDNNLLFIYNLRIDLESGVGLLSGQGSDPSMSLFISRNGGHTFGHELTRSAGLRGKYNARVEWTRLGYARDFVFKLKMTDPVRWTILAATANVVQRGS